MNQSGLLRWLALLAIILTISGCGGGNSAGVGIASAVTLTPATLSLNFGQVSSISVNVTDSSGNIVSTPTTSFSSDNTAIATVSTGGLVCAGTWDSLTTPVVCTPTNNVGTANITAVAANITSSATVVTVHPRIASLTIAAPASPCVSDTLTAQFTATGKDSSGNTLPLIGTPTWTSTTPTVATIDANGLLTAKLPGVTTIFATLNGVSSLPLNLTTCPPASITLVTPDATSPNAATLAPAATVQLTATATDILGNAMPDVPAVLTYSSSQPATATVGATGLVTAVAPGNGGIIASCIAGCITGFPPVYSNLVAANVTGTSATTVYVTGANATSIIPIDTTTNVAGTAITIPQINSAQPVINSFVFNKAGTKAYIGTNLGMLILDAIASPNTIGAPVLLPGKVLAVSPNGVKVVIAAPSLTQLFVFDTGAGSFDPLSINGSNSADFAPDSSRAFIVAGSNLYVYPPATPLTLKPLAAPATDVTFLSQGSAAYLAGGSASPGVNVRATCDANSIADVPVTPAPTFIRSTFDSSHVFAVNTTSIYDIAVTTNSAPCPSTSPAPTNPPPPLVTNSLTNHPFGATATPNQLIVTSNGTHAFVTNGGSTLLQYNATAGTTSAIALLGGGTATTTGGATLDSQSVYVGVTGTNDVQRIDVPSGVDVQQIPVGLGTTPDFVVVRPK